VSLGILSVRIHQDYRSHCSRPILGIVKNTFAGRVGVHAARQLLLKYELNYKSMIYT